MKLTTRKVPPHQKQLIYDICLEICKLLYIPKYQLSKITVKFKKQKDTDGLTWMFDHRLYVEINSELLEDSDGLVETLAHEFVHVKQYLNGDLHFKKDKEYWKGKLIPEHHVDYLTAIHLPDQQYENLPWEKEAIKKAKKIVVKMNEYIVKYKKLLDIKDDTDSNPTNSGN